MRTAFFTLELRANLFNQHFQNGGLGQILDLDLAESFGLVQHIAHEFAVQLLVAVALLGPVQFPFSGFLAVFGSGVLIQQLGHDLAGMADKRGAQVDIMADIVDAQVQTIQGQRTIVISKIEKA